MRILILPSWYPTSDNPLNGIFIREQVEALRAVHDVYVLHLEMAPRGRPARPRRRSCGRGYTEEWIEVPSWPVVWRLTYLHYLFRAFRSVRKRFAPDLIHSHIALPAGWGAAMLRLVFHLPVVLTENSSTFDPWLHRLTWRVMVAQAYAGSDVVIAVSEGLRNRIRSSFPRARPIFVIPNIVDTRRFHASPLPPTTNGYRLLFVGLLETDQKGAHVLLRALARLQRDHQMLVHLDLVGEGALRPQYEALAHQLGMDAAVTFHGAQPHDEIASFLQRSHALVLPSLHEAAPLVAIEALASGRPVVSTRCGGPEYLIDATNGRIVEPGQPEAFAEAMQDVLTHLNRYDPQTIAAAAAARYSYPAVTTAVTQVYRSLAPR